MDELVTSLLDRGVYSACCCIQSEVQETGRRRVKTELIINYLLTLHIEIIRSCRSLSNGPLVVVNKGDVALSGSEKNV